MKMNNSKPKPNTITLKLKGDRITADKLRKSIDAFYGLMDEVVTEVSGKKKPIKWIVSVRKGSIILTSEPEIVGELPPLITDEIFATLEKGVKSLEKKASRPERFTDKALIYLQDLASIPEAKGNGLDMISIEVNKKSHVLTKHVVANVDSLLGEYSHALGSIEGRLETISERGGNKLFVYESLMNRGILCYVNEEIMLKVLDPKYFGKRVSVSGMISYDKDGAPKRIRVADIEDIVVLNERGHSDSILKLCGVLG